MLVVEDSPYGWRVPIQIGTLHIDMALDLATKEEKRKLNCQWKRAELAASLCMKSANAKADDSDESQPTFNLAHVKCSGYFKRVNVARELLKQHEEGEGTFCAVPPIFSLNLVQIMLK